MKYEDKTKEQLINELVEMQRRVTELEASEIERKRAKEEIEKLAKFPSENPQPVLRVAKDGTILYANKASLPLLNTWRCQIGQILPEYWRKFILDVFSSDSSKDIEVECEHRTFSLVFAPVVDADYVNLYGLDITKRKQAEEKIFRLASIVESSDDAIIGKTLDGIILSWNKGAKGIYGYAAEEVKGQPISILIPPGHPDEIPQILERVKRGEGIERYETVRIKKDGKQISVSLTISPIKDTAGKITGVSTIARDITKRKQAEEKIKHLNDALRAIRNVNQLITRERDRERLLQGACESLIETRGYRNAWIVMLDESGRVVRIAEAGLGKDFLPMVERLKRGELTNCGQKALGQPGVHAIEDPSSACTDCPLSSMYHGRGAMTYRLEHAGRVFGLLSVSIPRALVADQEEQSLFKEVAGDIALALHNIELEEGHKKAQKELEKSAIYLDAMGDALFVLDAQGNIIKSNKTASEWWGYSPEEFLKMTGEQLFVEGKREKCRVEMEEAVRTGTPRIYETIALTKDGKEIPVRNSGTVMKDAEGKLMGFINVLRDITERKKMQERLVHAEKLAVLGQLAGGVGHELRNPLGAIRNTAYFLNMVLEKPEPDVKETLEILERQVGTCERIISSLLDFARPKPPAWRKVDINQAVQEALSDTPVPENVEVVSQPGEALPTILADPDQLAQVFKNLILNSIQAMPEGGQLVVKSEVESPKWMAVSITDTGVGISEDYLERLFEPLFTTKAKGIGLGLAVTKTLVEGHGGTIEVESKLGKGSTFTVRLPIGGEEK